MSSDGLAPGTQIEEFMVIRELGAGGFGITYLAEDQQLNRRVAVKEYLPRGLGRRGSDGTVGPRSVAASADYRWGLDRFLGEARVLAKLDHPQVVRVYRAFEAFGTAYMVMANVEGRSLAEELRSVGRLGENQLREILDGLTQGLVAVHENRMLHRDIKPQNVMLRTADDSPVLIDFGAARRPEMWQRVGLGKLRGLTTVLTAGYSPIEQYGKGGDQGPWTDIYALGAVAYRTLAGRVPDAATNRMVDDSLLPLQGLAPHTSDVLATAVHAALAVDAEDRPQSLVEWREMLGFGQRTLRRDPGPVLNRLWQWLRQGLGGPVGGDVEPSVVPSPSPNSRNHDISSAVRVPRVVDVDKEDTGPSNGGAVLRLAREAASSGVSPMDIGIPSVGSARADGGFVLGSHPDLVDHLVVHRTVSARHARIIVEGSRVLIEDLNSANGTEVNGMRLRPFAPHELSHGCSIAFGGMGAFTMHSRSSRPSRGLATPRS